MTDFHQCSPQELKETKLELNERYRQFQSKNMALDMTRGKPCSEQLDLAAGLFDSAGSSQYTAEDGSDCRNYG
ncbi:MAG: hypothetical protein PVI13_02490, partial [Desulfobacterales bacterium]